MTRQQILFVHKSAELLENLRQIFEERGHDVLTTSNTNEARELVSTNSVALISLGVNPSDAGLRSFFGYLTDHAATTPLLAEIATPGDLSLVAGGPPCLHVVVAPVLSTRQRVALIERLVPRFDGSQDAPQRIMDRRPSDSYTGFLGG